MNKRIEQTPIRGTEIDWKKVILGLDWSVEVTPVALAKMVNNVCGLKKAKDKFNTGQRHFGDLVKQFEAIIPGDAIKIRQESGGRFYELVNYTVEELTIWANTGNLTKIKKQEKKNFDVPVTFEMPAEIKTPKQKSKRTFPDNESVIKTMIILGAFIKNNSLSLSTGLIQELREKAGYTRQRSGKIDGKSKTLTITQEATHVLEYMLDKSGILETSRRNISFKGDEKTLMNVFDEVRGLLDLREDGTPDCEDWILNPIKDDVQVDVVDETKIVKQPEVEKKEESKPTTPTETASNPKVLTKKYNSFEELKEKREEITTHYARPFREPVGKRWKKGLILEAMNFCGTTVFSRIAEYLAESRAVRLDTDEIKSLYRELVNSFGDYNGFIKDRTACEEEYNLKNIEETLYIRLHMDLEECKETYPYLKFNLVSKGRGGFVDNVYEVKINRTAKAEDDAVMLYVRKRKGEDIIFPMQTSWIISRITYLVEEWGYSDMIHSK